MEQRRKKFEAWIPGQFGKEKVVLLSKTDGAYADQMINGMWFAFNAGAESPDWDV